MAKADERLWQRHRVVWSATLFGPLATTGIVIGVVSLNAGAEYTMRLLTAALAGLFLFGRFIILGGLDPEVAEVTGSLTSAQLFAMVTYLDLTVAAVLVFHAGALFRLPWFGSRAKALVNDAEFLIHSQPWVRRATFVGLVLFVAIPLAAMGSVGGTILGRMLGVSRPRIFLAILMGSLLGNGIMWLGSDLVNSVVDKHHPVVRFGGVALIGCLIALIEFTFRRVRRSQSEGQKMDQHSVT
ncbi:MAG: small multi-drug export protein [Planctomycetota bacterium]|nr:small multi-drug export protein [Planctomycetota bacterium]